MYLILVYQSVFQNYVLCNCLVVRCYLEANVLNEALETANLIDIETFNNVTIPSLESDIFDDTPVHVISINSINVNLLSYVFILLAN